MFYSKNGWDSFLQSGLGERGLDANPTPAAQMGGRRFPHLCERSSSGLDWSKPEQRMILPHFSFPRRPWGGSMGEIGAISEPTQVGLPW